MKKELLNIINKTIIIFIYIFLIIKFNKIKVNCEYLSEKKQNILIDGKENTKNNITKQLELNNEQSIKHTSSDDYHNDNETDYNFEDDLKLIKNYKGGNLEPEWNWVKNISIVYTWVDGSDPDYIDLKSKYNGGVKNPNNHRDRNSDELKYSIRSIEKYLPWHEGTIFIVTSQQIPQWLDTSNSRIKMVFHKDIFPEHIYPTYDSNTIELFLDKIPGLSERFLYFNDDIFLNNYIHPSFFFTLKTFYPKIYRNNNKLNLTKEKVNGNILNLKTFVATCYNTNELIKKYFDKKFVYYYLHHSVFSLYRDLYEPFRQLFQKELKVNIINKFRNHYEVQVLYLYQEYMKYATRHENFPLELGGDGDAKYFKGNSIHTDHTIQKYSAVTVPGNVSNEFIRHGFIMNDSQSNNKYFSYVNTHSNILVYCMNDKYSKNKPIYELTKFMIEKYPNPSSFEKREYVLLENNIFPELKKVENFSKGIINGANSFGHYDKNKIDIYNDIVEDYKMNIIRQYIDDKNALSGPIKTISNREKEEIDLLLNYHGEKLDKEWEWVKNISMVYVLGSDNGKVYGVRYELFRLKYALKSIKKYLPWFAGTIFLIVPPYMTIDISLLNNENYIIKTINQNELIPTNISFNKNMLEMYLDKIPGISEKFIYLKTNHYFINYIHPGFFFSNQFYPKYSLNNLIPKTELKNLLKTDESFVYTYSIIKNYFGKYYFKGERYLNNRPVALYRDLFEPVRQLFKNELNKKITENGKNEKKAVLPIYLLINYNIYGTAQPFYPKYVAGYGKIMNSKLPKLNNNRTIDFYGFDILSTNVENYIIYKEKIIKKDEKEIDFKKINFSNKLFFNVETQDLDIYNIFEYIELMKNLYD